VPAANESTTSAAHVSSRSVSTANARSTNAARAKRQQVKAHRCLGRARWRGGEQATCRFQRTVTWSCYLRSYGFSPRVTGMLRV
jgi:hypothetical protein